MSEWRKASLGDVLTLQRGFDITKANQNHGSIPVVSSSGINSYHDKAMVDGPGVVIGRKGTLGTCFFLGGRFWPHDTTLWVKDFKGNWPRFCYYLLKSLDLAKHDVGAANPTLNRNHLHLLPVQYPSVSTQRRISSILAAYDELIKVNEQRIRVLEEIAQRLFEEWFVHFRFPGHVSHAVIKTPDGLLPQGWTMSPFSKIAERFGDSVSPNSTPEQLFEHYSFSAFDNGQQPACERGETILSNKLSFVDSCVLIGKLNPRIPRIWFVQASKELPKISSTEFVPIRPVGQVPLSVIYAYAISEKVGGRMRSHAQGTSTSHQRVRPEDIMSFLLPIAPLQILQQAGNRLTPLYELAMVLRSANATLLKSRNLLLPRLICGEFSVSSTEHDLEAVA